MALDVICPGGCSDEQRHLLVIYWGGSRSVPLCRTWEARVARVARPSFTVLLARRLPLVWITGVCHFTRGLQCHLFTCSELTVGFEPTTTLMSSNGCAFIIYAMACLLGSEVKLSQVLSP